MEDIVNTSIPFELLTDEAEFDKQAKALVAKLQKDNLDDIAGANYLEVIDPSTQTIIYVYVLDAYIKQAFAGNGKAAHRLAPPAVIPEGSLWPYITKFLLEFDPIQARYVGEPLLRIVGVVKQGAEQTSNLIPAIQLLHSVILRLDHTSSTLTDTHFSFIRLCLLARAYSDAVQILDLPIYAIPSEADKSAQARAYKYLCSNHESSSAYLTPFTGLTQKFTSRKYLEYYLMAGLCYMGSRQYTDAMFCLEVVLTAPAAQNTASMIMVEAYKKWLLLGIVLKGEKPSKPKGLLQSTFRIIRSVAKPYECIAEAFESGILKRLQAEIQVGQEIWDQDCNTGLVHKVLLAFRKFSVVNLGKTFAALSMTEVARRTLPDSTDLSEATTYVSTLIATGQLYASLVAATQAGGSPTLRFLASPAATKSAGQVQMELATKTLDLQYLFRNISDNDHKLELSRDYVDYLKKLKKQKEQELKDGPVRIATFDEVDEELMADY